MSLTFPNVTDDRISKGFLLVALFFIAWLASTKNLVLDLVKSAADTNRPITPNVLMIVADDLGYDDTSIINGGGVSTPNLEQLAEQGVTFRRHYADSTCTPSRVAMLSGRYAENSGFRPIGIEIPAEFPTIAERFKDAGYTTYLTGKWHAGEDGPQAWPDGKGFDEWFGFLNQFELSRDLTDTPTGPRHKPTYHNPMLRKNSSELEQYPGHLTDILTEHTIAKLRQLQSQSRPWFVYHAFLAPHAPIEPAQRYLEQFPDTPEGKYTAIIKQLDDAIGQILSVVEKKNTLVIFISDNGGTNLQRNNNFPFHGAKNQPLEGAYRTPLVVSWPGTLPKGRFIDDVVMNVDIYPTIMDAIGANTPGPLDGQSLMQLMLQDTPLQQRQRTWEVYQPNTNTISYSLLDESGNWRQASRQGVPPNLFNLSEEPAGETDVADRHKDMVAVLTEAFWQEHWRKSLLPVTSVQGNQPGQTLYTGYDSLRTPYRYGFAIGLEIGPLSGGQLPTKNGEFLILAGQQDTWELRYRVGQGLEWDMGDQTLRDASFKPLRCNAIVLTGYLQPASHRTKKKTESPVKLYSSGILRDIEANIDIQKLDGSARAHPTYVNHDGKALFTSMTLSSFADSYNLRLRSQFAQTLKGFYAEKQLTLADVQMMDSRLCKE